MATRARLTRPPRILIASDQDHALWDLESFLGGQGYAVLREFSGAAVLKRARTARPDAILLDARLADPPSLELSRMLRDDPLIGTNTPILLLMSGRPTRKDHLAALRAGVWELLPHRPNAAELLRMLDRYVRARAETERTPTETLVDGVTGLYTSHGLARRARELIFLAGRHNTSVACVVFAPEQAVDPAAAGAGDPQAPELVPRAAEVLRATGRHSDAIGRVGSGEFAVVAPGADGPGAVKLAERLQRAAAGAGVALRAGYDTVASPRYTPVEPQDLLARASRALQLAKVEGKWIREAPGV